jgi:hypothetical protein
MLNLSCISRFVLYTPKTQVLLLAGISSVAAAGPVYTRVGVWGYNENTDLNKEVELTGTYNFVSSYERCNIAQHENRQLSYRPRHIHCANSGPGSFQL